jgi:hypothetical protein
MSGIIVPVFDCWQHHREANDTNQRPAGEIRPVAYPELLHTDRVDLILALVDRALGRVNEEHAAISRGPVARLVHLAIGEP